MIDVTVDNKKGQVASYSPDTSHGYFVWMDGNKYPDYCPISMVVFSENDIIHHEILRMESKNREAIKQINERTKLIYHLRSSCKHQYQCTDEEDYVYECSICGNIMRYGKE